MKHRRALGALTIAAALAVAACGSGDAATSPTAAKTIEVSMTDNEFTPNSIEVAAGQKVTFRFTNDGKVDHEAIVGTEADQADHESQMTNDGTGSSSGMDGMDHQSGTEAITVKPGKTGTLTQTFAKPGAVLLGCHEPGHYESGMKATIKVT
jgi:uncharacterized cupredoxin-like copper-binding protein